MNFIAFVRCRSSGTENNLEKVSFYSWNNYDIFFCHCGLNEAESVYLYISFSRLLQVLASI